MSHARCWGKALEAEGTADVEAWGQEQCSAQLGCGGQGQVGGEGGDGIQEAWWVVLSEWV